MKLRSVTAVHTARHACSGEPSLLLSDIVSGLGPVASGFWNVSAHESSHDERKRERVSNEQLSSARKREDDARFATSTPLMACLRHRFRRFRAFKMVETALETPFWPVETGGNGVETALVSAVSAGNGNGEWKRRVTREEMTFLSPFPVSILDARKRRKRHLRRAMKRRGSGNNLLVSMTPCVCCSRN